MTSNIDTIYPLPKAPVAPLSITVIYESSDNSGGRRAHNEMKKMIPKPSGQVGCIRKGGYNLQSELGWDKAEYKAVQKFVQECLRDYTRRGHLRVGYPISMQPDDIIRQVQLEVKKEFPILSWYKDDWPSRDMIFTYLSNASSMHTQKRQGN